MNEGHLLQVEALIKLISAAGLLMYLWSIQKDRNRGLLERRLSIILANLALLFFLRGLSYLTKTEGVLITFIYCLSAFLPLSVVLFIEGLLRRHAPIALKITGAVGTVGFCIWTIFFSTEGKEFSFALVIFQVLVLSWVVWVTSHRDKASLSQVENRYIDGVGIAAAIAVPLLITDYRTLFGWNIPRMGALGGLFFVLALVELSDKKRKKDISKELLFIVIADFIGSSAFCQIWNDFQSLNLIFPIFLTMHLFILMVKQILLREEAKVQDWVFAVTETIQKKGIATVSDFHQILNNQLNLQTVLPLIESELTEFDLEKLRTLFLDKSCLKLSSLKKIGDSNVGVQQMIYILESHQMNQVYFVGENPFYLILMNAPDVGSVNLYQREVQILRSFFALIPREQK